MGPWLSIDILNLKNSVYYSIGLNILQLYKEDYSKDRRLKLGFKRSTLSS